MPLNTTQKGKIAEQQAQNYLQQQGYELLTTNYRQGRGEIDLIMRKPNLVIFVEVKSRKNADFGNPEIAVTPQKQNLIQQTAEAYLLANNLHCPIRFDIIAITGNEIEHFEDVF